MCNDHLLKRGAHAELVSVRETAKASVRADEATAETIPMRPRSPGDDDTAKAPQNRIAWTVLVPKDALHRSWMMDATIKVSADGPAVRKSRR